MRPSRLLPQFALWPRPALRAIALALSFWSGAAFAQVPGVPRGPLRPVRTVATFTLNELFGVSWPDQPIEFRYDGDRPPTADSRMIGPGGIEVPYQWVSSCSDATAAKGCIVVRSPLPANSNNVWTLQAGRASTASPDNPVTLLTTGNFWEVSNGLTGIRIVAPAANPSPFNRAPVQGIQLPDATWTGAGSTPNLLYAEAPNRAGCAGCSLQTPMYTGTGYTLEAVESGPLKVTLRADYTFRRPAYLGSSPINSAGTGHYTMLVTLYSGSKSLLVDEDSDMQFSWFLPLFAQLTPDQLRFRGHDSVSQTGQPDPACGYETPMPVTAVAQADGSSPLLITVAAAAGGVALSNAQALEITGIQGIPAANGQYFAKTTGYPSGQFALYVDAALTQPATGTGTWLGGGVLKPAYRGQTLVPTADAYLDLTYSSDRPASYYCAAGGRNPAYRKLVTAYPPASRAAGWYNIVYNSSAGPSAPAVGFFAGRASRQIKTGVGPSQPGIYTSDRHWISGAQDAGIQVDNLLRGPDGLTATLIHRNWGIWVGTQADLTAPAAHQAIGDDQNSLTGINLSHLYSYHLVFPDPPGGWTWQYLSASAAQSLIGLVRNGTSVCGSPACYYNLLNSSDGSVAGRALLAMWRGNSTAAVQSALDLGLKLAQQLEQALVTGDNRFDTIFGYYRLGLQSSPYTAVLNAILMDSNSTRQQRESAKAILALVGCIFWDEDWFPIAGETGESIGLANQIQQYLQYRTQAAAAAPQQPYLATVLAGAAANPVNDFADSFSDTGAPSGSTHYTSAFLEPLILNYLNLSLDGTLSMSDPKWAAYANWELSIQTPPEPRFGNLRKGYSNGDGNTEADVRPAMLANAINTVNPELAGNLMWAWRQSNSSTLLTEDSQFVTTLAAIDVTIPALTPALASANFPGYHSAERHAFGTPNETALWFINGGFYSTGGHRHYDDGQVSIYAHAAPLAIDWNANLYSPPTPGRYAHNSVVYDTELNHPWNGDSPSLNDVSTLLKNPANTEFAAFRNSTTSTGTFTSADGTVWTRTVRTLAFNPASPAIYVKDTFAGPGATAGKTLTWNLMAAGPVATPAGTVTPVTRFSAACQNTAGQLPSGGTAMQLSGGLQRFTFTGVVWPKHATGGIDWDLFTLPATGSAQFAIGNWGHGCHAGREMNEFRAANGKPFAESQHILRIHDAGPFTTLILPYRKTEAPTRTVTQDSCGIRVTQGNESACMSDSAATWSDATTAALTVFDDSTQTAFGVTATGGPQEIVIQPARITWTLSGFSSSPRMLTLPANWISDQGLPAGDGTFIGNFLGGPQAPAVTFSFTSAP